MHVLIVLIHLIVCIALILIVLLQTGKGASMGAMFGGAGNQTLFGNTGASTFLSKATTIAAVVFMLTSLTLAYVSKSGSNSVVSDYRPSAEKNVPAPAAEPPKMPSSGVKPQAPEKPETAAPEQKAPAQQNPGSGTAVPAPPAQGNPAGGTAK